MATVKLGLVLKEMIFLQHLQFALSTVMSIALKEKKKTV